jgi:hypothetical protein
MDDGRWTMNNGRWTTDDGRWTKMGVDGQDLPCRLTHPRRTFNTRLGITPFPHLFCCVGYCHGRMMDDVRDFRTSTYNREYDTYLEEVCVVDRGCPLARALHMVCFPLFFPSLQYSDRKPHHQKHVNSVNYRLHQK